MVSTHPCNFAYVVYYSVCASDLGNQPVANGPQGVKQPATPPYLLLSQSLSLSHTHSHTHTPLNTPIVLSRADEWREDIPLAEMLAATAQNIVTFHYGHN